MVKLKREKSRRSVCMSLCVYIGGDLVLGLVFLEHRGSQAVGGSETTQEEGGLGPSQKVGVGDLHVVRQVSQKHILCSRGNIIWLFPLLTHWPFQPKTVV